MAFTYLPYAQEDQVAQAIYSATQYAPAVRTLMLRGLPDQLAGMLPGAALPPLLGVKADLKALNEIERLTDGTVPLQTFLRNALQLAGILESMQPVREALAMIEQLATGAPPVDLAAIPETKERITGGHNDMVAIAFMAEGLRAAASVVKLEVPRFDNEQEHKTGGSQTIYLGTGWIVAPGLLLTNHHVFNARNDGEPPASDSDFKKQAEAANALFDFDVRGVVLPGVAVSELIASDNVLDYALARFADNGRAPLRIASKPLVHNAGSGPVPVNIIQHPNGEPKKYGIRNNLVTGVTATDIRYFTDTEGGSSGSPVFDDNWEVVALHRGSTYAKDVKFQGKSEAYVNIGTRIDAILADIEAKNPGLIF